jgi:site-specific DNA recombinase
MPRCAIYARFSTDRQSETSAQDQIRECRRRADAEGWDVVQVYADLAISGANIRRPGMTAMLADAAAGAFDIVLAEDLDRIARDLGDVDRIFKQLRFADVALITLANGRADEMQIGFKGTMDALELGKLREKIRRGQRGALSRGRIPGGLCYGYDVVREFDERGQVDAGRRRVNPDQAAIVLRIMQEYAAGKGPKAIAKGLNADRVPSPRGGEWRASAIVGNRARAIGILHNPIYTGRFVWGRVQMRRDPESRNRVSRPTPAVDRASVDLPELRIVDDELWQRVQDVRAARAAEPVLVHRRRPRHLLAGKIRCGCGGSMTTVTKDYLGCSRAREAGTCGNTRKIRRGELERRVLAGLRDQLLSPEAVSVLVREYHLERDRRLKESGRARAALERRLAQAEAAVARLVDAIAEGGAEFAELRGALTKKVGERDRLRADVQELDAGPVIALHPHIAEAYRARVDRLTGRADAGEISEAEKAEIRSLVEAVYVRPAPDGFEVELIGLLSSAIALATGRPPREAPGTAMMVAEEGLEPPTRGL